MVYLTNESQMMMLIFTILTATSVTALRLNAELNPESEAKSNVCSMIHKPSEDKHNFASHPHHNDQQESYSQAGQDARLAEILPSTGFFVESGAHDGVSGSNTLLFENKGWQGLLVEPNPTPFAELLNFHRRAFAFNGALSTTGQSGTMKFDGEGQTFHIANKLEKGKNQVPMEPLEKLLTCLNQTTVDFWSLDVEGVERPVLSAFPFKDIEVGVMLIEKAGHMYLEGEQIDKIMRDNGFKACGLVHFMVHGGSLGVLDQIWVNPSYFQKRGLETPGKC